MKILSFILRLIGGLGIAYGVALIILWLLALGGATLSKESILLIGASLFAGVLVNALGNYIRKK